MTDTGVVTTTTTPAPAPVKSKRGRETSTDMLRSIAVVMVVVGLMWFFGIARPADSKAIRPVDPSRVLAAFTMDTPGVPAARTTPAGWVINGVDYRDGKLRIGFVIDADQYVEFAAGSGAQWLSDQTAKGKPVGTVDVGGVSWTHLRAPTAQESLTRTVGATTLVVGGLRESSSLAEIEKLAATVR